MTWRIETTVFVRVMGVTAGARVNKRTRRPPKILLSCRAEISGEACVATMVEWLWSWAVITEISGLFLSLNQSLLQIRARTRSSANKMSGAFKISGEAS